MASASALPPPLCAQRVEHWRSKVEGGAGTRQFRRREDRLRGRELGVGADPRRDVGQQQPADARGRGMLPRLAARQVQTRWVRGLVVGPADTAIPARRLRQVLALDALVTSGNGLAYLLAAGPLATFLGLSKDLLVPIGVFLLAYGVAVGTAAARVHPPRAASLAIIAANVAWAVASVAALLTGALSPTLIGGLWIAAQAVVVGGFAAAKNWALRRLPSVS